MTRPHVQESDARCTCGAGKRSADEHIYGCPQSIHGLADTALHRWRGPVGMRRARPHDYEPPLDPPPDPPERTSRRLPDRCTRCGRFVGIYPVGFWADQWCGPCFRIEQAELQDRDRRAANLG